GRPAEANRTTTSCRSRSSRSWSPSRAFTRPATEFRSTPVDPYIGEIRLFAGNFAPLNWALCNGQLMAISQNTPLFSLPRTNCGGDGKVTFGLPNLQGAVAMDQGQGPGLTPRSVGETGGSPTVTLLTTEMPSHAHSFTGQQAQADSTSPNNNFVAVNRNLSP